MQPASVAACQVIHILDGSLEYISVWYVFQYPYLGSIANLIHAPEVTDSLVGYVWDEN